ncbi:hypothetical protein DOTSEDRAFT_29615 [Dothistroma septosporum NZE10]|uniref:DUF7918 domain-containing protein n=1 Tax=Dothistroma septosporum (strain NZE10 / CBS 128990) TaxID=675120 RepID=N1PDS3_DOTSN|nr:hypothetical protein DOTSEDRAFT_29615 [Dothistroma septosporum NZE10]
MAIIDNLPGVEVTVVAGGTALEEYIDKDTEEKPRTITRYVEAVSGQHFEVHINVAQGTKIKGDDLRFDIYMDGTRVDGPILSKSDIRQGSAHKISAERVFSGDKYCFSTLETVSDGKYVLTEASRVKSLGKIEVTVSDVKRVAIAEKPTWELNSSQHVFISEKLLKGQAISHSISFTPSKDTTSPFSDARSNESSPAQDYDFWDTKPVHPRKSILASFIFKYRSIDALRAMLIIPRTPTPEPEEPLEKRDPPTLTPAEQLEVIKRLQAVVAVEEEAKAAEKAAKEKIERERADADGNPRPRKIARPQAGDTLLAINDAGDFSQASTDSLGRNEKEVVELD